jgi:phage-related protein
MEDDFRDLSNAIATSDWSRISAGARTVSEFRSRVLAATDAMRRHGRISEQEHRKIIAGLKEATENLEAHNVQLAAADSSTRNWGASLRQASDTLGRINSRLSNTVSHMKGVAGINVFEDMMRSGIDIASNIDRVSLSMSKASLKIGSAAAVIATAAAGLVTVGSDVAAIGNIAILGPAFLTGLGAAVGAAVVGFKDLKTVLKDLGPQFTALQDSMSAKFWDELEGPMRRMVEDTFPSFKAGMEGTATAMGGLFAEVADAIREIDNSQIDKMFNRLNSAIKTGTAAVKPFMHALGLLGQVGSQYFGRFAEWIVDLYERFDRFITKAAADGRLNKWIEEAIDGFKNTGRAIGGVVEIFQGINTAATKAGIGGLKDMADELERMADIAKSPDFQKALVLWLEGAKDATDSIMGAINDRLMPALGNIAPVMNTALDVVGGAMGTLIGYLADIIENPQLQAGLLAMTDGLNNAVKTLEPAIKPMGDSLGSLLEITGHIAENIAKIVTVFAVELGPEIDKIGRAFEKLADPLTESVTNAVTTARPLMETLRTAVIEPLVNAINTGLLPAIDSFVREAGPFLQGVAEAVGPVFETLVGTTLPNVIKFAETLFKPLGALFDLMTPALRDIVAGIGTSFGSLATAMEDFNEWADPAYKAMDKIARKAGEMNDFKISDDSSPVADLITKYTISSVAADPAIASFAVMFSKLNKGWTDNLSGFMEVITGFDPAKIGAEVGKFFAGIVDWFKGGGVERLDDTVNQWFEDNLVNPVKDGWDNMMSGLEGWYEDVKSGFQDFMSNLLGFNTSPGEEAEVHIGGGAGSRGVGGKITPEMIGLGAPEEGWLQGTIDSVTTSMTNLFNSAAESITSFGGVVLEVWNSFWGGLGENLSTVWTNITTFLSTAWTNITTGISTWLAGLATGWNTFWATFPETVSRIWTQITTWISTSVGAIVSNIASFIGTVSTNWNTFWSNVWTKVSQIWTQITTWISGRVGAIIGTISSFIGTVTANWNSFWTNVWTKVSSIWSQIVSYISGRISAIIGSIVSFGGQVIANWNSTWSNVQSFIRTAWGNIVSAVSTGVTNVMSFITSLPGRITGALGNLGGLLLGAGQAIMNGFRQGLESAWGAVQDFVGGIASWIAENKGPISYDRTLLTPAGEAIMGGLLSGLESKFTDLKASVLSIADLIASSVTDAFSHSKMYIAGAEAALGLVDGLAAQRNTVAAALGAIIPSTSSTVGVAVTGNAGVQQGVGTPTPTRIIQIEEGAIQVTTPTKDPGIVAAKVIDEFANFSML